MYYVYILKLTGKEYYSGFSADLKSRITEHKQNKVKTTRNRKPRLYFYCAFRSRINAVRFEKYLKSSSGFAFRNNHLI